MKRFQKLLIIFGVCWSAIFALTFITGNKDLQLIHRFLYSFALAVIATMLVFLYYGKGSNKASASPKKGTGSSPSGEPKTFYIYEGFSSKTLVYRVENNKIYRGMSRQFEYEIKGNKICKALSDKLLYRIENNRIYKGSSRAAAMYRIENGKIFEGDHGYKVVYRITTSRFG